MIDLSEVPINVRARLADALVRLIEADPRVRRWRRLEFADDGGAVVVVELHPSSQDIAADVILRELEFLAAITLPQLTWVRVQQEYSRISQR
jgi:hypothetical protein